MSSAPLSGSASRASAVRDAIAITRMEGGAPSAFCLDLLARYVSGEISGAVMRERMLKYVKAGAAELEIET
ncbi:hypothetical protein [Rhodopseudomonas sp.]|uniref:antitoxin VbhA family protein n=1 Tax=Rhodopseudomonas sp. TaxID=1078 RepID=UPI0039E67E64